MGWYDDDGVLIKPEEIEFPMYVEFGPEIERPRFQVRRKWLTLVGPREGGWLGYWSSLRNSSIWLDPSDERGTFTVTPEMIVAADGLVRARRTR